MKNIYFLIFIVGTQFLCASSLHALDSQDMQKFREFIQEGKSFHKWPAGQISEAEIHKILQVKSPWSKNPVDFLKYFNDIVKTEAHADAMSSWLIRVDEEQYVLALDTFAKIYAESALHDRFLSGILHAEDLHCDFLEINYRNKHIQNFCKLLVEKMDVQNPLLKELKQLCSGESLASIMRSHLYNLVKSFECKILSRDDWAEEFKQWGPPYEVQAAQIQKCIDQCRAITALEKEEDVAVILEKTKPLLKELLKQLKIFNTYKQTENKEDWKKLVLLFKELKKNILPESQATKEQKAKGQAYIDSHPKEKEELTKLVLELVAFTREANDLQEGVFILATEEEQAKSEAQRSSPHESNSVPSP